jgi:hypothetical protein
MWRWQVSYRFCQKVGDGERGGLQSLLFAGDNGKFLRFELSELDFVAGFGLC